MVVFVLESIAQSLLLVGASALVAGVLCWLANAIATQLHRHAWAAFFVLCLVSTIILRSPTHSEFVKLSAMCSLIASLFLWLSHDKNSNNGNRNNIMSGNYNKNIHR